MREKCAWIFFVTTVAVYVPYFVYICRLLNSGKFRTDVVFNALIDAGIFQSMLAAAATAVFLFRQRKEPKDERDVALEACSFRYAYGFLAVSCFLLVMGIPLFSISPFGKHLPGGLIALLADQAVLLCFVGAEIVKYLTLALGYRRAI